MLAEGAAPSADLYGEGRQSGGVGCGRRACLPMAYPTRVGGPRGGGLCGTLTRGGVCNVVLRGRGGPCVVYPLAWFI